VVLAAALTPSRDSVELAKKIGIPYDAYGFFSEAHPKLRPVETNTAGVYLAGTCQAPRGIAGTIAHASGAASKVVELFSSDELEREPTIARVNEGQCVACFDCMKVCPYRAISEKKIRDKKGNVVKAVASVNEGLCQGCGLCVATCRSKSIDLDGFTEEQLFAEIGAL
jgi:heterodisulfide reductase subunit A